MEVLLWPEMTEDLGKYNASVEGHGIVSVLRQRITYDTVK